MKIRYKLVDWKPEYKTSKCRKMGNGEMLKLKKKSKSENQNALQIG